MTPHPFKYYWQIPLDLLIGFVGATFMTPYRRVMNLPGQFFTR